MTNILPVIVSASMAIVKGVLNFVIAIIVSVYMISDHKIIFYHFKRLMYTIMPKQTAEYRHAVFYVKAVIFFPALLSAKQLIP